MEYLNNILLLIYNKKMSELNQSKDNFIFTPSSGSVQHDLTLKQNVSDAISLPLNINDISTLQSSLDSKINDSQLDDGVTTLTDLWSSTKISNELTGKSNTSHSHIISDVTALQSALDARVVQSSTIGGLYTHNGSSHVSLLPGLNGAVLTSNGIGSSLSYQNIPSQINDASPSLTSAYSSTKLEADYATITHTHNQSEITGLVSDLSNKLDDSQINDAGTGTSTIFSSSKIIADLSGKSDTGHSHSASEIGAGLVNDVEFGYLDGSTSSIQLQLNGKAPLLHAHDIAQVTLLQSTLDNKINQNIMTAEGDLIYRNSLSVPARLPRGTLNQVLTSNSTTLSWVDPVLNLSTGTDLIQTSDGAGGFTNNSNFSIIANNTMTAKNIVLTELHASDILLLNSDDNSINMTGANGGIDGCNGIKFGGVPSVTANKLYSNTGKLTFNDKEIVPADASLLSHGYIPYFGLGGREFLGNSNLQTNGTQLSVSGELSINNIKQTDIFPITCTIKQPFKTTASTDYGSFGSQEGSQNNEGLQNITFSFSTIGASHFGDIGSEVSIPTAIDSHSIPWDSYVHGMTGIYRGTATINIVASNPTDELKFKLGLITTGSPNLVTYPTGYEIVLTPQNDNFTYPNLFVKFSTPLFIPAGTRFCVYEDIGVIAPFPVAENFLVSVFTNQNPRPYLEQRYPMSYIPIPVDCYLQKWSVSYHNSSVKPLLLTASENIAFSIGKVSGLPSLIGLYTPETAPITWTTAENGGFPLNNVSESQILYSAGDNLGVRMISSGFISASLFSDISVTCWFTRQNQTL